MTPCCGLSTILEIHWGQVNNQTHVRGNLHHNITGYSMRHTSLEFLISGQTGILMQHWVCSRLFSAQKRPHSYFSPKICLKFLIGMFLKSVAYCSTAVVVTTHDRPQNRVYLYIFPSVFPSVYYHICFLPCSLLLIIRTKPNYIYKLR